VRITTLGTASPYPRPGNPCSSFLLESRSTRLWIDAGAGTLGTLLAHCSLSKLSAVWISHTHADHFSDLAVTFYALRYADVHRPPLTVFGPPGWVDRLRAFLTHTGRPSPLEDVFDVRELSEGATSNVGDLQLVAAKMHHDAECFGARITSRGGALAYSGDTGPCRGLSRIADHADLLVCEAGYGTGPAESRPVHLSATEAGRVAAEGRVGRLVLTHLAGADPRACVEAAAAAGATAVTAARPGLAIHVRGSS